MSTWIEIDGSRGEGGGQILRTSLTLAVVTGRRVRLRKIRAKRSPPGLRPQHLASVRAAAQISQAEIRGDAVGSRELSFIPGDVVAGDHHFNIGTAGGTGLVLHTVYLPLILRGQALSTLTITGGTHNDHSPCYHYLANTWRPYLNRIGFGLTLQMRRPGFYPRGGGVIEASLQPAASALPLELEQFTGDQGNLSVTIVSAVAGLPEAIAQRQARQAEERLQGRCAVSATRIEAWPGGPGTMLGLLLEGPAAPTFFFGLGARGKPAERVADEAVDALLAHLDADPFAVDPHAADQLVLPLALAPGRSAFRTSQVTQHLLTNVAVIREFVEREITCQGEEGNPGIVVIE